MVRVKTLALVLLTLMFFAASAALAADAAKKPTRGKIKSIADDKTSFVISAKNVDDVTVKVNADTKYKLDGADSTFADVVKVDARVSVTLSDAGVATEVATRTPKKQN